MLSLIITKELKSILLSPKFPATFGACSILLLLSVYVGIREYNSAAAQTASARQLIEQEQREATSWMGFSQKAFRDPDPMQVFVSGLQNDIGRLSDVTPMETIKLTHSVYSDDPLYAIFRFIDFAFIVQIVLSLFAILFTYDTVNGERESGTLALTFSAAVPRSIYLGGKIIGAWLGLLLPLVIPVLIAVLIVLLSGVPFHAGEWIRFASLLGVSLLYFTFFVLLGTCISALTKRSSASFLVALVAWIVLVLIVPRAGVMAAGQIVRVPSAAELDGQIAATSKDEWSTFMKNLEERWKARNASMEHMSKEDRDAYRNQHEWAWMNEEDKARKDMQQEIDRKAAQFKEDVRNRNREQMRLGLAFARISPAASFQLAAMQIAGTDVELKSRYEDAMQSYREIYNNFREKKMKESGDGGGIRISIDSEKGFSFSTPRDAGALDISDLPRFVAPIASSGAVVLPAIPDFALLLLACILAFGGAFLGFVQYDVR
jgi:ABC-type transport system involved in multi-copper enzyme maturation permease subunit